ncbi:MAG TPA: SLC13 family permease [bacterium]|nr:SLC13 family permease [bacterium]
MDIKAIISISVFVVSYLFIAIEKAPRVYVALSGTVALILFKIYTPQEVALYVDWETLGFLFGIFISVKIVEQSGFFNYFALLVARMLRFNTLKIFIFFPLMAAVMAGFIDSISVIVFLAPLTYALSRILKFNPAPYIVAEICLANIGGAGTLMGDPPNVILGSMFHLGFTDFVKHNWIISMSGALSAIFVFYRINRKELVKLNQKLKKEELQKLVPREAIEDTFLMKAGLISLMSTVLLLVLRDFIKEKIPINIALSSLIPAFTILTLKGQNPKLKNIIREIDIETLLFLSGLFVIVGALEKTGVMSLLANSVSGFAENGAKMAAILFWGGAVTSGFIDNVPEAISLGYLIKNLTPFISYSFTLLIWAASLGLDMGGNFTPVGASANIVGYTFLENHKIKMGWKKWIALSFLPTITALLVSWTGLFLKYKIGFY